MTSAPPRTSATHVRRQRRSSRDCARRDVAALDLLPLRRPTVSRARRQYHPHYTPYRGSRHHHSSITTTIITTTNTYRDIIASRVYRFWSSLGCCWFTLSSTPRRNSPSSVLCISLLSSPDSQACSLRIRRRLFLAFVSLNFFYVVFFRSRSHLLCFQFSSCGVVIVPQRVFCDVVDAEIIDRNLSLRNL